MFPKRPAKPSTDQLRAAEMLRRAGLRVTSMRLAILSTLEQAASALNAQQVFDALSQQARASGPLPQSRAAQTKASLGKLGPGKPGTGKLGPGKLGAPRTAKPKSPDRVTVYRTLNSLVEAGLAHRVDPGDRVFRFSLTDHAGCSEHHHVHEHPHFVCDSCGTVECLEGAEVVIKTAPPSSGKDPADPVHTARAHRPQASARTVRQSDAVLHGTCGACEPLAKDEHRASAPAKRERGL